MTWEEDATLAGAETILRANEMNGIKDDGPEALKPYKVKKGDERPLLVIPDSGGRIRTWNYWRRCGLWRDVIALCSRSTPEEYLDYLQKRHVVFFIIGEGRVDYRAALEELNARYGVKKVRVDSGGTLNGILLRQGLVAEVNVLIHPALVGGTSSKYVFRGPDLTSEEGVIPLKLKRVKKVNDGLVWLQYQVVR